MRTWWSALSRPRRVWLGFEVAFLIAIVAMIVMFDSIDRTLFLVTLLGLSIVHTSGHFVLARIEKRRELDETVRRVLEEEAEDNKGRG